MKKIFSLSLTLALITCCFAGCGKSSSSSNSSESTSASSSVDDENVSQAGEENEETTTAETNEEITTTAEEAVEPGIQTTANPIEMPMLTAPQNDPLPVVDGNIIGKWEAEEYTDEQGNPLTDLIGIPACYVFQFEFSEDNTLVINSAIIELTEDEPMTGTWTQDGNKIEAVINGEGGNVFELKDNRLVYTQEDASITLKKVADFSVFDPSIYVPAETSSEITE
ncbi:MAG TPA: lipocalin family protein [Ruminococcus sp.]|nr:lipocalin family protein [Ruminococcus sp.]